MGVGPRYLFYSGSDLALGTGGGRARNRVFPRGKGSPAARGRVRGGGRARAPPRAAPPGETRGPSGRSGSPGVLRAARGEAGFPKGGVGP